MRRVLPLVVLMASVFFLVPARADAITLKEIVQLSRAGLTDEVLLALIEVDQRVFAIDSETLTMLKEAGVSERVIIAIVRSGRIPPPAPLPEPIQLTQADPPEPQVVVIEHERPVVREVVVPVAVPVYVPVVTHRRGQLRQLHHVNQLPYGDAVPPISYLTDYPVKKAEPVYWGWGGKRRPDSWQPQ
jgi:hypothetical protein